MKLKGTPIPGFRIDKKTGKPVRIDKGSVSDKLRRGNSNRVKVKRK